MRMCVCEGGEWYGEYNIASSGINVYNSVSFISSQLFVIISALIKDYRYQNNEYVYQDVINTEGVCLYGVYVE